MNCQNHPDIPATAYCRSCGKPLCNECRRDAHGTVFCAEHAPAPAPPPPPQPQAQPHPAAAPGVSPYPVYAYPDVSPGLALFLGMIPGVGAIYNGQYAKGLVHAIIFGILISMTDSRAAHGVEAIFVMACMSWWPYMVFEAYHTARKRRAGEPVDEYSSLIDLRSNKDHAPLAAIALIVIGILLLMRTLDIFNFEYLARYWPVLLIAAGVYLLYGRFAAHGNGTEEVRHER